MALPLSVYAAPQQSTSLTAPVYTHLPKPAPHPSVLPIAESLGGVESLANHPAVMTHASVPAEKRTELRITDDLIRLSVGIEDVEDLLADLENALGNI